MTAIFLFSVLQNIV